LNYKVVIHTLGALWIFLAVSMLMPLGWAWYYGEGDLLAFIITIMLTAAAGISAWKLTPAKSEIGIRDGFAIVTFGWVSMAFFGAFPAFISGTIPSFTDAFFESMSGFTTTGASILNDIESLPHGVLFWRSLTHWLGGMGIILLSLAILPMLGVGGMQLFRAEVPGPVTDKLTPRIRQTAEILWGVYLLLTVSETALLMVGGMSFFDALCHTFGTMATGGFSTKNASIAAYDNPFIHWVIILFMIFAGVNFALHFRALKGDLKVYPRDPEFRFFLTVIAGAIVLLLIFSYPGLFNGFGEQLRHTVFQVVSIMTTTGYVTHDFESWTPTGHFILLALMFIGGMAGSTGGGMKTMRIFIIIKQARMELRQIIHPRGVFPVRLGKRVISDEVVKNIFGFFLLYALFFILGAVVMTFFKLDLVSAIAASAACLNNIGPGLGAVGPTDNYYLIPALGKWVLCGLMLLGRLEVYTVVILFSRFYWKR